MSLILWTVDARSIPETGLPLLLGGSFLWFPNHTSAFRTFFIAGGTIKLAGLAMLVFCVHPKDEPLGKSFQGRSRARYHAAYDVRRRQGLAGPEKLELLAKAATVAAATRVDIRSGGGCGARCCDEVFFNSMGAHPLMKAQGAVVRRRAAARGSTRSVIVAAADAASAGGGTNEPLLRARSPAAAPRLRSVN
jgi:hypothetical protein